jgi:hypothetical protein
VGRLICPSAFSRWAFIEFQSLEYVLPDGGETIFSGAPGRLWAHKIWSFQRS